MENNYVFPQFTFQSIDFFFLTFLCFCVTCFLFLNLTCALYLFFSKFNSLMVGTNVFPLNFRWFPPHIQLPVFVHELQCATDGSLLVLRLLPISRLKKTHYTSPQTLLPGLIFISAWLSIAVRLFWLVSYRSMNFVKFMTICSKLCARCRITLLF